MYTSVWLSRPTFGWSVHTYFIVSNVVTSHFLNGSTPTCQPVLFSELLSGVAAEDFLGLTSDFTMASGYDRALSGE